MQPDDKTILYQLMYVAFLDIRAAAVEKKSHEGFFKIADFLHNLPAQLQHAQENDKTYHDVMVKLRERAKMKGCESWLDNAIQNITNWEKSKTIRNPQ